MPLTMVNPGDMVQVKRVGGLEETKRFLINCGEFIPLMPDREKWTDVKRFI